MTELHEFENTTGERRQVKTNYETDTFEVIEPGETVELRADHGENLGFTRTDSGASDAENADGADDEQDEDSGDSGSDDEEFSAEEFLEKATVGDVEDYVDDEDNTDALEHLLDVEQENQDRKGAVDAIENRLSELAE